MRNPFIVCFFLFEMSLLIGSLRLNVNSFLVFSQKRFAFLHACCTAIEETCPRLKGSVQFAEIEKAGNHFLKCHGQS